jgi:hypothetical protein
MKMTVSPLIVCRGASFMHGRDRFKWSTRATILGRTSRQNVIITHLFGLRTPAKGSPASDPETMWKLLFTYAVFGIIFLYTKDEIYKKRAKYSSA